MKTVLKNSYCEVVHFPLFEHTLPSNMAVLSQQLSLKNKKLFVSGFAREIYGELIPTDLIKIIRWYMDEVLYWSMEGKFLRKFCSKRTGQIRMW